MAYPNPNRKVRPIFTHLEHRAVQQVLEQVRRLPARDRARDRRARVGQRGQQPQRHLDRDQLAAVLPVVLPRAPPARARARTAQPCWATMHHSRMLHRRELLIPVALRAIQYAAQQCLATFLARGCVNASAPLATNGCGQSRVSRVFARMHWQELARGAPAAAAASLRGWLTGPRAPRSPPARDRAALCMLAPGQGVGCTECTTRQCLAQPPTPGEHAQHAAATWVPHCCTRSPPLVPKLAQGGRFMPWTSAQCDWVPANSSGALPELLVQAGAPGHAGCQAGRGRSPSGGSHMRAWRGARWAPRPPLSARRAACSGRGRRTAHACAVEVLHVRVEQAWKGACLRWPPASD